MGSAVLFPRRADEMRALFTTGEFSDCVHEGIVHVGSFRCTLFIFTLVYKSSLFSCALASVLVLLLACYEIYSNERVSPLSVIQFIFDSYRRVHQLPYENQPAALPFLFTSLSSSETLVD